MRTTLIDDEEGQIVLIPAGFELPVGFCVAGDEATVRWDGEALVLTPAQKTGDEDRARLIDV